MGTLYVIKNLWTQNKIARNIAKKIMVKEERLTEEQADRLLDEWKATEVYTIS